MRGEMGMGMGGEMGGEELMGGEGESEEGESGTSIVGMNGEEQVTAE